MARTTIASLQSQIAELEARNAALEARLVVARTVYRDQKERVAELEAQLNARGAAKVVKPQQSMLPVPTVPTVTAFTRRDGTVCERTRLGNRAYVREVAGPAVPGIEVSYS